MTPPSDLGYRTLVHSVISQLKLPDRLSFEDLQQLVAARRARRLVVRRAEELRGTPTCAMTYSNKNMDLILLAPAAELRREDHFVCHEFGHLLLGHHDRVHSNVTRPLPHLAPTMVSTQLQTADMSHQGSQTPDSSLGRIRSAPCSAFSSIEEKRAELFADILMEHLWRADMRVLDEPVRFAEVFG